MFWPKFDIEKSALDFLTRQPFAHRGLHDASTPENSLAAFDRAIERGYGIELDVQPTLDGDIIVFHDADLERMTGIKGEVARKSSQQLQQIKLKGTNEPLQRLQDVLLHIRGRVPVLIEVKAKANRCVPSCMAVRRALEGYKGPVAVMSFHPGVPYWFAKNAPKIVRGLVMTESDRPPSRFNLRRRLRRQLLMWRARAQFIAYDVRRLPSPFIATARARGYKVLTWTVRGDAAHATAATCADQVIFEGDLPAPVVAG